MNSKVTWILSTINFSTNTVHLSKDSIMEISGLLPTCGSGCYLDKEEI